MDKDPAKGESGPAAGFPGPSSAPSGSDSGVQAAKPGNTYQIKRRSPIACRRFVTSPTKQMLRVSVLFFALIASSFIQGAYAYPYVPDVGG